jgi:autotransporter-associated beta strand protein
MAPDGAYQFAWAISVRPHAVRRFTLNHNFHATGADRLASQRFLLDVLAHRHSTPLYEIQAGPEVEYPTATIMNPKTATQKFMNTPITRFILSAIFALAAPAIPQAHAANIVWDTSTTAGFQNGNGTWGSDNFWTTVSGAGSGTTLSGWNTADAAWLGGNSTVAGSPTGNFTITVSGTQVAAGIRQIQNGAGNFTLQGGEIQANFFRADTNTLTINSVIGSYTNVANARVDFSAQPAAGTLLILGGNNTLTNAIGIAGASSGGGTVRLNHQNALGLGNSVTWVHNTALDLNGYSISGKDITVTNTRTGFLLNTGANNVVWSGNVSLANASSGFRAGGTGGEVEISGIMSGIAGNTFHSLDSGVLRLSGNNTYIGDTNVRGNSTLIVGHASALGSTSNGTFISTGATLDLNGFNVGNETITLQETTSKLANNNTSNAANVDGNITISTTTGEIGGAGNLTLGGVISSTTTGGFSKTGAGTLSLNATNSYTGNTTVSAGILNLANGSALGSTANGTTVASGGQLRLGGVTVGNETLTISGSGAGASAGALRSGSGSNTYQGKVTLGANATIFSGSGTSMTLDVASGDAINLASYTLTVDGAGNHTVSDAIVGTGGLTKAGSGYTTLSAANSYSGATDIQAGRLILSGAGRLGSGAITLANPNVGTLEFAVTGNNTMANDISGNGALLSSSGETRFTGAVTSTGGLTINSNSSVRIGNGGTTGSYSGSTTLGNSAAQLIFDRSDSYAHAGDISGNGSVVIAGAGTTTFTGNKTYTGNTTVSAGTLAVNGNLASAVTVSANANLQGSGTLGALSVSGQLSPGNSIESLGASSVSFLNGSTYAYELNSSGVLSGDLLYTTGALNIASTTTLSLTELASGILANDAKLTLISYGSWNNVLFTYNGTSLANGAKFTLGSNEWLFKYDDTTGGSNFSSDQSGAFRYITMTVVPEPNVAMVAGSLALMALLRRRRD